MIEQHERPAHDDKETFQMCWIPRFPESGEVYRINCSDKEDMNPTIFETEEAQYPTKSEENWRPPNTFNVPFSPPFFSSSISIACPQTNGLQGNSEEELSCFFEKEKWNGEKKKSTSSKYIDDEVVVCQKTW